MLNVLTHTIKITSPGKIIQASTNRWTTRSNLPPIKPVVMPINVEIIMENAVAEKPTMTDSLAPYF